MGLIYTGSLVYCPDAVLKDSAFVFDVCNFLWTEHLKAILPLIHIAYCQSHY